MADQTKEFIERLQQKMDDYCESSERLGVAIPTCDVADCYRWIREVEEEMGIDE